MSGKKKGVLRVLRLQRLKHHHEFSKSKHLDHIYYVRNKKQMQCNFQKDLMFTCFHKNQNSCWFIKTALLKNVLQAWSP